MFYFNTAVVLIVSLTTFITSAGTDFRDNRVEQDYPIQPVPLTKVAIEDSFWSKRLETNWKVTIPYTFKKCEETGRFDNFERAARVLQNDATLEDRRIRGYSFDDTDPYKILEGASYGLSVKADPAMNKYLDEVIAKIAAAQEPDGYLYTARTINPQKPHNWAGPQRWVNVKRLSHELYNMGHLYEAAVAHYQATGKRTLLDVAVKNADLLCEVFGPGKNEDAPGHQIIEMGLVKLYRVTGQKKYLDLAKFFLDTRGPGDRDYGQAHKKVVEQDEAVGHAVRATYMYCGMADVAALTGEQSYLEALNSIWASVVGKKLYITGGIGAAGGHEGFGPAYELPNLVAYCETCASIANAFWNHRMFLLNGDAKYMDVFERVLYNGLISGVSLDGKSFFYPNPLESDGRYGRSPWFGCACCPSNVPRFMPQVPGYVYAHRGDELFVNLFIAGQTKVQLADQAVTVKQKTLYPWDGKIKLTIEPEKPGQRFTLHVRIPGWARNEVVPSDLYRFADESKEAFSVSVNNQELNPTLNKGFVTIRRAWQKDDSVEINLPMPVRRILSHEKIKDNVGKIALQRGPIVYCIEWPDVKDGHVVNLLMPDEAVISTEFKPELLGGVQVLRGAAISLARTKGRDELKQEKVEFTAIPYYAWAHRGPGEMAVWLARTESAARPLPAPTIASTSKASASGGDARALNDQREPHSSGDHSNRFLHWWPRKGTKEWVQYDFAEPAKVLAVEVYWFDDTGRGECRLPKSWQLFYRGKGDWKPVQNPDGYGCEGDRYNRTTFDAVETDGLRIEVQLLENFSSGIHELRVIEAEDSKQKTEDGEQKTEGGSVLFPPVIAPPESFFEKVRERDRDVARDFYKKYIDIKGMPVVAASTVADLALQRTYDIVTHMLAGRPDVLEAMIEQGMYLVIIGKDQVYTDLPENRNARNPDYLNERVRGTGGFPTSFGEENLLSLPIDRYDDESIAVHEFCHTIDGTLRRIDPTWRECKNTVYRNAVAKGLFKGTYAGSNSAEYWCETAQAYFDTNRINNWNHGPIGRREQLKIYDPEGYELVRTTFNLSPDQDWRYTPLQKLPNIIPPPAKFNIDPYYTKLTWAREFTVVGRQASDEALLKANDTIRKMFAYRHDILKAFIADGIKLVVLGPREKISDLPECKNSIGKNLDLAARFLDYSPETKLLVVGQENVLGKANDPHSTGCQVIRVFAKALYYVTGTRPVDPNWDSRPRRIWQQYELGLQRMDVRFDAKLKETYESAMNKSLWKGTAAINNRVEYWTEGVLAYFDATGLGAPPNDADHPITTREALKAYNPDLFALVDETMAYNGKVDWRYQWYSH